jgi:hypothetical protein
LGGSFDHTIELLSTAIAKHRSGSRRILNPLNVESMEPFVHTPLDLEKDQIRLVCVQAGQIRASPIQCEIAVFDRVGCPKYDALSYVWGAEIPKHTIALNGKAFDILDNLHAFLDQVRAGAMISARPGLPAYTANYLWIDQLCVDQTSSPEKSQQVQRMSLTYKQARQVVAWLGRASEDSETGMHFIPKVVDFAKKIKWEIEKGPQLEEFLHADEQILTSMTAILDRPYWTRLWIVQEFMLPEKLIIACGDLFLQWDDLGFIRLLNLDPDIFGRANNFIFRRKDVHWPDTEDSLHKIQDRLPPPNLGECLAYFENEGCSVPHDKVYGMLAIADMEDKIRVDYAKPTSAVYWEVMKILGNMEFPCFQQSFLNLGRALGVTGREEGANDEQAMMAFGRLFDTMGSKRTPMRVFSGNNW